MFFSVLFKVIITLLLALRRLAVVLHGLAGRSEVAQWRGEQTIGAAQWALNDADDLRFGLLFAAGQLCQALDLLGSQCATAKDG